MISTFNEQRTVAERLMGTVATKDHATASRFTSVEQEVPLQITVPPRVKRTLDLQAVESGRTRRALVLQALQKSGISATNEDIAGRRGSR